MRNDHDGRHLTLDERRIISNGIKEGASKQAIADTIGKDASTVAKEIRSHRVLSRKCSLPLECSAYRKCKLGRKCTAGCPQYVPFKCKRRDRTPGACNGCPDMRSCRFDQYRYEPETAHHEYRSILVESRAGVNTTPDEIRRIGGIMRPLVKQGLSPYAILQMHPEIGLSEHTLYNYIEDGVFRDAGIDIIPLDLRRQVKRKPSAKAGTVYKKRKSHLYLKGREYSAYKEYMDSHPEAPVVQMDTVYNDIHGPFMQTFKFMKYNFMIVVYRKGKTQEDMRDGVLFIEEILGSELFCQEVEVLLTDRGSEFTLADEIESRPDGARRTRVFYCDPMASHQKGSLENNHELIRYICPKGTDLKGLGLTGQKAANAITSHIASYPLKALMGKCPWEYMEFLNPDFARRLKEHGFKRIATGKELNLTPLLLKPFREKE